MPTAGLIASFVLISSTPVFAADASRQHQVEQKSEKVMPFSMSATMHTFDPTASGGVQTVKVTNGDAKQVTLVRSHLRHEATAFAGGNYTDPAAIHGGSMPGLEAMHAGAKRIVVRYADVQNGARIAYTTQDPTLVSAIHAWFKAQVSDHGAHAAMKM